MPKGTNPGIKIPDISEASPAVRTALQQIVTKLGMLAKPVFASVTFTGMSGVLKAVAGVVSGGATLDDVADGTSYERVAAAELSSGVYKNATTAVKGIASFNPTNFSVTDGAVSLAAGGGLAHSALSGLDYASAGHTGFEPAVTKGNLTAGSTKITVGGTGTGAVIGTGVSVDVAEGNLTHNNLGSLQGGIAGEYNHLTNTQVSALHAAVTLGTANGLTLVGQELSLPTTASPTFAGLTVDTDTLYVDKVNHRLGVGTTVPDYRLHFKNDTMIFMLESTSGGARMQLKHFTAANYWRVQAGLLTAEDFAIGYGADSPPLFRITGSGGNIGIGVTGDAAEKLEVAGKIRADTAFNLNGTDGVSNSSAGVPTAVTVSGGIVTAVTKNDWLDQNVKSTALPTFNSLGVGAAANTYKLNVVGANDAAGMVPIRIYGGYTLSSKTAIELDNGHASSRNWQISSEAAALRLFVSSAAGGDPAAGTCYFNLTNSGYLGLGLGAATPNEQLEVAGKIRANTAFNLNGTDGVTQAAAAGTTCIPTAIAGGIVTAQSQVTYAADGTYNFDATSGKVSSITITKGMITAITTAP